MTLREAREAAGLTQAGVARRARLDRRRYHAIEHGERPAALHEAKNISRVLGIPMEDVFTPESSIVYRLLPR